MKKKINIRLVGIAILAILFTLLLTILIFYELFQEQVMDDLKSYTHLLSSSDFPEDYPIEEGSLRITLVEPDGTVSYDSAAEIEKMDNHVTRPEIEKALQHGEGEEIRKSATMDKNTFYYAVRKEDGSVLRVSKEASSIWNLAFNILPVLIFFTFVLIGLCMLIAHFLTKSLMRPIEQLAGNIDGCGDMDIYNEMLPFMQTIREQHRDILKNARMRQEFTANVTHELKTPLTSISGYSELIENGMATEDDIQHFAGEIHRNSTRLLNLINDIIRLSELDVDEAETNFERVDLYALAEDCVSMCQFSAEKHGVTLSAEGSSCFVEGDKGMLEEVLYNLCDNAIRYNKENGKVRIMVQQLEDKVILSVRDTGIGIPDKHQERIFERFYRVDKSRSKSTGGTGLGLAIVKHIVARHDAQMEVRSEVGKGTEIRIIFQQ